MNNYIDRILTRAGYLYIIFPFVLFFIGWLRWYYAAAAVLIVLVSYLLAIKSERYDVDLEFKKHKKKVWVIIGIIAVFVFFSGLGGYTYQTEDHQVRNGIFRDLVTHPWPFRINEAGNIPSLSAPVLYVYYIIYWLPAAFVGKIFGWHTAQFFLFLWSLIGVLLAVYFLFRLLKKISFRALLIFFLCSNLYIIVSFFRLPFYDVVSSDYILWHRGMLLAGSYLGGVYWIFNQSIAPILIGLLLLNNLSRKNIIFLYALSYLHGPFFFIGFFPFVSIIVLRDILNKREDGETIIGGIKQYFTFQNTIGAFTVLIIGFFYLSESPAVQKLSIASWDIRHYFAYIIVCFLILSAILFRRYYKDANYWAVNILLIVLPLIALGDIQPLTFSARVSIAPVFMLLILAIRYFFEKKPTVYQYALTIYFILACINTSLMVGRSVAFTTAYYLSSAKTNRFLYNRSSEWSIRKAIFPTYPEERKKNFLVEDDLISVDSPDNPFNKFSRVQLEKKGFFSTYLIK